MDVCFTCGFFNGLVEVKDSFIQSVSTNLLQRWLQSSVTDEVRNP